MTDAFIIQAVNIFDSNTVNDKITISEMPVGKLLASFFEHDEVFEQF